MAGMSTARAAQPRRPLRAARGAVVGAVAGGLALAGHAAGGGAAGPESYAVVVLVVAAAVGASRSRWTPARLVVMLLGAQAAVHAAAWLVSPSGSLPGLPAAPVAPGHVHDHAAPDVRMLLAHLAAACLAALLLAAIEGAVLSLWAAARTRGAAEQSGLPAARRPLPAAGARVLVPSDAARAWSRRGPPRRLALA